jgi:hypothetical protein
VPPCAAWNLPMRVCHRARERAAHVPEELGLHEVLGDGPAVDHHEGPVGPRRALVQLARDELLAGARLARDEHVDVRARHLVHALVDLAQARAAADDVAEAPAAERLLHARFVGGELVQQDGVLQDERGLAREDAHDVQAGRLEQVHHVVVAHVDEPQHLPLRHERRHHDRAELQVHDALARLERLVVQRVAHDDGLTRLDAALEDAVRQVPHALGQVVAVHVARRGHFHRAVADQEHEALVRVRDVDDRVQQRLHLLGHGADAQQEAVELAELAHAGELRRAVLVVGHVGHLVVQREHELEVADAQAVAVEDLGLALALAVDAHLWPVDGRHPEVAPVEHDLRVEVGHGRVVHADVVAHPAPDGGDLLVDREAAGAAGVGDPFEARHGRSLLEDDGLALPRDGEVVGLAVLEALAGGALEADAVATLDDERAGDGGVEAPARRHLRAMRHRGAV